MDEPQGEEQLVGHTKTFVQYVTEQRNGGLLSDLSQEMRDLVVDVRETQKAGTLTLTLKVIPTKDPAVLMLQDQIGVKPPKMDAGASIFFVDEDGYLHRHDPRQPELPLQVARERARQTEGG